MEDDEPILLHEPDLMLAILRAAWRHPAGLDDALAELRSYRLAAGEPEPPDKDDLLRRLTEAVEYLEAAQAIAADGPERYRLTERGRRLIAEHPDGVDASVLHAFPEFRRFIAARGGGRPEDDPRLPAYTQGLEAFAHGQPIEANPHPDESSDHLAWESGWTEGRDATRRS